MNTSIIDASGAQSSGSSVKIYQTPNYQFPHQGACVMHGEFAVDRSCDGHPHRVEVVELQLPGIKIRVRSADVHAQLHALRLANEAWRLSNHKPDTPDDRHRAFEDLSKSVMAIAAKEITVKHLEDLARWAFRDGMVHGRAQLRDQFRGLLEL